jgi:ATP-dependent DNA ligase
LIPSLRLSQKTGRVIEPGRRGGLWVKRRINLSQEFVISGYVPSHLGIDSVVIGFYRDKQLRYAARVRDRLRAADQRAVVREDQICGDRKVTGRWGQGLTAEKMKECIWVKLNSARIFVPSPF